MRGAKRTSNRDVKINLEAAARAGRSEGSEAEEEDAGTGDEAEEEEEEEEEDGGEVLQTAQVRKRVQRRDFTEPHVDKPGGGARLGSPVAADRGLADEPPGLCC